MVLDTKSELDLLIGNEYGLYTVKQTRKTREYPSSHRRRAIAFSSNFIPI
ncbi:MULTISPECIES: hypothetical protein [Nostoc]|uniref:Uncharacterized protein n=1 Tax=Nostoc paludosum FACHB-159 TaxID=2692908 RepID=A0ABR8KIC2_9NOSO|nr:MULTISPECIES: hypothetical protein [Nostoc]MBD2682971.1 hypothetical protein [Nostoc sp. FACHB-857]MBD2739311.1 hypothetical protein [Nostoc paludosum FACHB-159]